METKMIQMDIRNDAAFQKALLQESQSQSLGQGNRKGNKTEFLKILSRAPTKLRIVLGEQKNVKKY
jgi:hypothetical protein